MSDRENQIVYILINEAMEGYVKIGKTTNLEQRMRSLDNTSVPLPFECVYAAIVKDSDFVERQLHDAFSDFRVRDNREFFKVSEARVAAALKLAELEDVTPGQDIVESPEDQKALDKARAKRRVFNFDMVNVPKGAELAFTRNHAVTCKVIDNRNVEFEGEAMSLSMAAKLALEKEGLKWAAVQGPAYWEFEGETLHALRLGIEEAN